jgi:hypothetical protein
MFLFIELKLQVAIRKVKQIKELKILKNIKTGYATAKYWSALFRCDQDRRTFRACCAGALLNI